MFTCLFVFITGLTTYFYTDMSMKKTLSSQIETKLSTSSYYFMHSLDAFMYERMLDIKGVTHENALQTKVCDSSFIHNYLVHRLQENTTFENLMLFDADYELIVCASKPSEFELSQYSGLWNKFHSGDMAVDYLFNEKR